ncbi:hypothetical protein AMJ47_03010 [Parcubacteria bacterium DG_72]|nr:MAG: hypothetical protein AMJ47_03010 [Parcubacteria bacterium DG_72]
MKQSILEKFGLEKVFIIVIIVAIVAVCLIFFWMFFGYSRRGVQLISPLGREEWEIGQTYEIKWKSTGIGRIGIVLFNADKPEWIAENLPASPGLYEWRIQPGHEHGSNFWVAVFEYPWRQGNQISYSKGSFSITYPELASCDSLSIQEEWPYLASDVPDVRRVFITKETFTGDLDGLEGANEKCQIAAAEKGFSGDWTAFIGGDSPEQTAVKRIELTPRGLGGIFIDAEESLELLRGATCHRVLGRNFNDFLAKLSDLKIINEEKLSKDFLSKMEKVWFGRIDKDTQRNCTFIMSATYYIFLPLPEKYSHTVTCQNWTFGKAVVPGYERGMVLDDRFSICYTPQGEPTYSVTAAGLASGVEGKEIDAKYLTNVGKVCSEKQHLLCIEN